MKIDKIGVELEFGSEKNRIFFQNNFKENISDIHSDGSVNTDLNFSHEIVTKPFKAENKEDLLKFIDSVSKNIDDINSSMGFHVHLSFKNYEDYLKILSYRFNQKFKKAILGMFKDSLEKKRLTNDFCLFYKNENAFDINTLNAIKTHSKDFRYFAVNYNAYNIHNTIEFRIFPMNKAEKLKKYIDFLVGFVESYLEKNKLEDVNREGKKQFKEVILADKIVYKV